MEAWGFKMLACCWVFGGMFDLLRSLLWFSEGPSSGIVGGYRYRVPGIFLAWRQANEVFAKRANFFCKDFVSVAFLVFGLAVPLRRAELWLV